MGPHVCSRPVFAALLLIGALAALPALLAPSTASAAAQKAESLGAPPVRLNDYRCGEWGRSGRRTCVSDVWLGNFEFRLSPKVVRVGQRITGTVSDATANYGHSWSWGTGVSGKVVSCRPAQGVWTKGPSSGTCTWQATTATGGWVAASACINPLGQTYCEEDYFAVLDNKYLLHGYVRDAGGAGIAGARVTFTRGSEASYAVSGSDGYYDAVLKRGDYAVRASKPGVKLCAAQRTTCENPTTVRLVSDKELDFGPLSAVVITGHVRDHRGTGLGGVSVQAAAVGKSDVYKTATDTGGAYRIEVPGGAYNVRPVISGRTDREKYLPETVYLEQAVGSVTKDFQLAPADEVDLATSASRLIGGLWWTTWAASAAGAVEGTVSVENGRGDPVASEPVTVDAPYWDVAPAGSAAPEVVICDDAWQRVYPGGSFERRTDGQGRFGFHMFLGGTAGNFFMHARETRDVTVLDVERFGQLGAPAGPTEDIVTTLQNAQKLGLPKAPLAGPTQAKVQQGLLEWLLRYRLGEGVGADRLSPWGEFGPIRTTDGSRGGIVLYPSGNPGPLRDHLLNGTPLPPGYTTLAMPIKHVVVLGQDSWYVDFGGKTGGLQSLGAWELEYGAARAGFAEAAGGAHAAWFGGPYPPAATNEDSRSGFDRCVPGAAPQVTLIEKHSPLRLLLRDTAGRTLGYDRNGKVVTTLGGFVIRAKGSRPETYVVPAGAYTASLTGTGAGAATLVARTTGAGADTVRVFRVRTRRGATGTLRFTAKGAARTLRFGGRTSRARTGIALRVRGLPKRLAPGRAARMTLRVTSQFGAALRGALVTARATRGLTDGAGKVTLGFVAPRSGRISVRISLPGFTTLTRSVAVRRR